MDQQLEKGSGGVIGVRARPVASCSAWPGSFGCRRLPHHRRILATCPPPPKSKRPAAVGDWLTQRRGGAGGGEKWGNPSPLAPAFVARGSPFPLSQPSWRSDSLG